MPIPNRFQRAVRVLDDAVKNRQIESATMYIRDGDVPYDWAFGNCVKESSFLLGSISKPMAMAAFMTLHAKGLFQLDDPVSKYIPEFRHDDRESVLIRHLLTHTSGLPDQVAENAVLRKEHAGLSDFVKAILKTPLHFQPGTQYEYSSMGILLASEIGQRLSGIEFKAFVRRSLFEPLGMKHSAFGREPLHRDRIVPSQVEFGAPEAGGGSPDAANWNWNSDYWRDLGAPWGGAHASASDVGKFLEAFLKPKGVPFPADIAQLMIKNHNAKGLESRGLGFDIGMELNCPGCSGATFGHTGSTGTIAWADPSKNRVCVILTSLPAGASKEHPRQFASHLVAKEN
jgi:CubicO group peptidase (beta-lactamase class C family)